MSAQPGQFNVGRALLLAIAVVVIGAAFLFFKGYLFNGGAPKEAEVVQVVEPVTPAATPAPEPVVTPQSTPAPSQHTAPVVVTMAELEQVLGHKPTPSVAATTTRDQRIAELEVLIAAGEEELQEVKEAELQAQIGVLQAQIAAMEQERQPRYSADDSKTPPMSWEGWAETGDQDIPESKVKLDCEVRPPGYRSVQSEGYLHRFHEPSAYLLVVIDGAIARPYGGTAKKKVDLENEHTKDLQLIRPEATCYLPRGSAWQRSLMILAFARNDGSAKGLTYLGGKTYGKGYATHPRDWGCGRGCQWRSQRWSLNDADRWFKNTLAPSYTPSWREVVELGDTIPSS